MLDGKHTTSSCPLRTCHVPIIPPSSSSTSNDEANNILQQQSDQQPWWLVHQDDHLSIHTKIVVEKAAATTASSNSNDVVVLFWYTLWCCDSLTLNNMAHVDLETESSTATSQQPPYNLGVAVMPEMYAPHQIQEWFQQIPERFLTTPTKQPLSSTTASSSSSLDALLLVGPELETFLLSSSSSFPWVPLVLVASTTTTTTTSRTPFSLTADAATSTPGPVITASTDGGGILFRRAYQQAQWLQTKFPRHLFLTRLFSSSFTRQSAAFAPSSRENDDPTNGCSTLPCSIISLVSGTSVILSSSLSSTDGAESKCQVIHRTIGSFREEMNEPEQLLRVNSMQQALQDYLDSSRCSTVTAGTTSCSSLTLIASSHLPVPFQSATNHLHHHHHLPDLKDGNEIDLEEDDTSIEQANHEYSGRDCQDNHFPRNHQFHFQQLHVSNMRNNDQSNDRQAALPPTAHTTAAVEVDATSFVPHLLVLGTGCASPSPLRGSSAYGLFLPHVVRDTASPSKANGHGDGKMPTVRGLHLILTAVLECGEDVVSQLYRFLPPPPPNVSPDAQLDHNAWFHYQLRQICFIWISHAHLDHYGGLPTLLRRIHEAHHLIQHTREQRPISHPPHDEHAAKRFKRGDENGFLNMCSPNDCYRPLVIAPPRVLAYLQALLIPADMYDGVTQADYDRSQTWQRWVTEITLTTTVRTTCPCKSNFTRTATRGANEVHLDNYRDYRPFSFLRNVPVDHGCAHAYGLFLGLAPCLWYSERERNLLPPSHGNNHHPRFGDPHSRVLCFSGDTLPCRRLVTQSPKIPTMNNHFSIQPNVEWLIHEATFDDKKQDMAQTKGHSTSLQALDMAQQLNAKLCLLTHFSQRYRHTIPYALPLAPHDNDNNDKTGRFPRALFAFDGLYLPLLIHSAMN
jgi:ribonuclease BN (tRNA processing enzyme)